MRGFTIKREDPSRSDVVELLQHGEAEAARLYPAESNHHLPLDALRKSAVYFLVARDLEGRASATGALVFHEDWAEIKRMWVEENARGLGLSKALLGALTAKAQEVRIKIMRLETGVMSHAALSLYEKAGFQRCDPFTDYKPDPVSVFMQKVL